MDSIYSWNQPEQSGSAQKIWSRILNHISVKKILKDNQMDIHHLHKCPSLLPVFSTFSQNVRNSWHNPPIRTGDSDCERNSKENTSNEKIFFSQILHLIIKKREYNKASLFGYELQIEYGMVSTLFLDLYPWNVERRCYTKTVDGLHEEILDFYRFIMPTDEEKNMRHDVINRLKQVVYNEWPNAVVDVFGSCKTELHLPTSDIDVVIFGNWDNPLWRLSDIIKRSGIASDCKVLDRATVPIVKMTDKKSDVRIDISFNMKNGIQSADLIKSYISQYSQLPYLVLILKQYLLQQDLNEVWTGGISSYSLILMCISFLKHCTKKKINESGNLGLTLIYFLEMYGRTFDYCNTAIRIDSDVSYVAKVEIMKNMDATQWSSILCIEDPLDPSNDIGRSSFGAFQVKLAFDYAYSNLIPVVLPQSSHIYNDQSSILGRIIRITPEVIKYRDFIKTMYSRSLCAEDNNSNHRSQGSINETGDRSIIKYESICPITCNQMRKSKPSDNEYKRAVMKNIGGVSVTAHGKQTNPGRTKSGKQQVNRQ